MTKDVNEREADLIEQIEGYCKALRECLLERGMNLEDGYKAERNALVNEEVLRRRYQGRAGKTERHGTFVPAAFHARMIRKSVLLTWGKTHYSKNHKWYSKSLAKGPGDKYIISTLTNDAPRWAWGMIRSTEEKAAALRRAQKAIKAVEMSLHVVRTHCVDLTRRNIGQNAIRPLDEHRVQSGQRPEVSASQAKIAPEPRSDTGEDWAP